MNLLSDMNDLNVERLPGTIGKNRAAKEDAQSMTEEEIAPTCCSKS